LLRHNSNLLLSKDVREARSNNTRAGTLPCERRRAHVKCLRCKTNFVTERPVLQQQISANVPIAISSGIRLYLTLFMKAASYSIVLGVVNIQDLGDRCLTTRMFQRARQVSSKQQLLGRRSSALATLQLPSHEETIYMQWRSRKT
jgi:hypothetical protein